VRLELALLGLQDPQDRLVPLGLVERKELVAHRVLLELRVLPAQQVRVSLVLQDRPALQELLVLELLGRLVLLALLVQPALG